MLELMKKQTTDGFADIRLRVPAKDANTISEAIEKFLVLAGLLVREVNEDGEKLYSLEEVFPDIHPGAAIKGARLREGYSQVQLAEMIGAKQHHISEMENGKRSVGKETAKRLSKALNTEYRVFL